MTFLFFLPLFHRRLLPTLYEKTLRHFRVGYFCLDFSAVQVILMLESKCNACKVTNE